MRFTLLWILAVAINCRPATESPPSDGGAPPAEGVAAEQPTVASHSLALGYTLLDGEHEHQDWFVVQHARASAPVEVVGRSDADRGRYEEHLAEIGLTLLSLEAGSGRLKAGLRNGYTLSEEQCFLAVHDRSTLGVFADLDNLYDDVEEMIETLDVALDIDFAGTLCSDADGHLAGFQNGSTLTAPFVSHAHFLSYLEASGVTISPMQGKEGLGLTGLLRSFSTELHQGELPDGQAVDRLIVKRRQVFKKRTLEVELSSGRFLAVYRTHGSLPSRASVLTGSVQSKSAFIARLHEFGVPHTTLQHPEFVEHVDLLFRSSSSMADRPDLESALRVGQARRERNRGRVAFAEVDDVLVLSPEDAAGRLPPGQRRARKLRQITSQVESNAAGAFMRSKRRVQQLLKSGDPQDLALLRRRYRESVEFRVTRYVSDGRISREEGNAMVETVMERFSREDLAATIEMRLRKRKAGQTPYLDRFTR